MGSGGQLAFGRFPALYSAMVDIPPVKDFEISLHKADGTVSIVMNIIALGTPDAKLQASLLLNDEIAYAVIWQGVVEVATVHRDKPN